MAIVAAHAVGFGWLVHHCDGTELAVDVRSPVASPVRAIIGEVPAPLVPRVVVDDADGAPAGPGLHRRQWTVSYRGGFSRSVGAAQLVGPFQDPAKPACSARVIVGQKLLAEIGGSIRAQIDAEMKGESIWGIGDYRRVEGFALRWATLAAHPDDREMIGEAPFGYVKVAVTIVFDRAEVPITIALIPERSTGKFRLATRAEISFDNRVVQWVSNRLRGDKLATRLARRQIDGLLSTTLAPPPPFQLPGGQLLRFVYCDEPPEIVEGAYGALPFAVAIGRVDRDPTVLPPRLGRGPHRMPPAGTSLALDLDLDALNALLYELWRGGFLDRRLGDAGLDQRFNTDPMVQQFLSIRISPVRLALPPVIAATAAGGLRMSADTRVAISDGAAVTTGRLWGGLDFRFAGGSLGVDLGALELSCERAATQLVPCYADLVGAMRGRGAEVHGALTTAFVKILSNIFVDRRLAIAGIAAELVLHGAMPSATLVPGNGTLHLDLDAALR